MYIFTRPFVGKVLVDGYDTQELSPAWLRRNMGVVSQASNVCIHQI